MHQAFLDVDERDFEAQVLERSREVPVVVDFWAPWCGPCRTLGPILEELAAEADGQWVLVKINSDENAALAQALGVRGIPAVKAFVDGQVVNEFTGALPKAAVQQFLESIAPSPVERLAREAAEAGRAGDRERERALWDRVLDEEPSHELARIRRARLLVAAGERDAARADLAEIGDGTSLHEEAARLALLLDWADRVDADGGPEAIRERAAENPDDVASRYGLGCALAVGGDFEGGLAEFLEVVRRDRSWEDDAGRRAMIAIFGFLGDEHALTREWRGKLSSVLF